MSRYEMSEKGDKAMKKLLDESERIFLIHLEDNHFYPHLFAAINDVREVLGKPKWTLDIKEEKS